MNRAGFAVALVLGVAGCANGVAWNSPFQKATAEDMARKSAMRGYKEVRHGDKIMVAATHDGVSRVRKGQEPAIKVAAIGFGPRGEKVIFEASKDGMLEKALMDEFERRHGGKQT
jgi:hypothetical protein